VNKTEPTKTIDGNACPFQIGQLDAPRVADDDVLYVALAIDEYADLSSGFV
jgi:hypothetical protein